MTKAPFLLVLALLAVARPALAETAEVSSLPPAAPSPRSADEPANSRVLEHFDVEVDPIAYVAQGHSLHLGLRVSRLRFDVGSFSLVVPQFVHGQRHFEEQARGYGLKLDTYLFEPGSGPFVGAEGAWFAQEIIDLRSHERVEVSSFMAGGRVGWELPVGAGFFVRPWVGLSYRFGNDAVQLPGGTFNQSAFGVFPTVHVGYIFH
jgi:hypothetical protein